MSFSCAALCRLILSSLIRCTTTQLDLPFSRCNLRVQHCVSVLLLSASACLFCNCAMSSSACASIAHLDCGFSSQFNCLTDLISLPHLNRLVLDALLMHEIQSLRRTCKTLWQLRSISIDWPPEPLNDSTSNANAQPSAFIDCRPTSSFELELLQCSIEQLILHSLVCDAVFRSTESQIDAVDAADVDDWPSVSTHPRRLIDECCDARAQFAALRNSRHYIIHRLSVEPAYQWLASTTHLTLHHRASRAADTACIAHLAPLNSKARLCMPRIRSLRFVDRADSHDSEAAACAALQVHSSSGSGAPHSASVSIPSQLLDVSHFECPTCRSTLR